MTLYQRKSLRTGEAIGQPGPLPDDVAELSDDQLARLGYDATSPWRGQCFVPVPAPEPAPAPRVIPVRDFMRRFEPTELVAIEEQAVTDPAIGVYLRFLEVESTMDLDAPELATGLAYLVGLGLLTSERAAAIAA